MRYETVSAPRKLPGRRLPRSGLCRRSHAADPSGMRLLLVPALLVCALAWSRKPLRSEPLQDANVAFVSLKVNAKGEALFTYRRSDGRLRHVLAWGRAQRRRAVAGTGAGEVRWDYAGGWGGTGREVLEGFKNRCQAYDGPALALLVAACKAPNGTYWTVQAWQRRLPPSVSTRGFPPDELGASRRASSRASSEARGSSRTGHTTAAGRGCSAATRISASRSSGSARTRRACRRTEYGRNLYIDTLNSPYGTGLAPRVRDPHAPRDRHVLSQLRPAAPVRGLSEPGRPPCGRGREVSRDGRRSRCDAGDAGRAGGLTRSDLQRDDEFSSVFDQVMNGDKTCAGER